MSAKSKANGRPEGARSNAAAQKPRKPKSAHGVQPGSLQANRIAIAILEVLAGERTPADAAQALGISLPRYYQLETRAVNGLVAACEPRPKGKQASPATRIASLERQLEQSQREVARQQSLVRAAHRSLGLKAAPAPAKASQKTTVGGRQRKPSVRALRAVKTLQENARENAALSVQTASQEASQEIVSEGPPKGSATP